MRIAPLIAALLACAAGASITGCGSAAKVDAANEGLSTHTSSSTTSGSASSSSTTGSAVATVTQTVTASSTRTSSAPAFTQQEGEGQALAAAVATVKSQGYTPNDTSEYHPQQTLRVLTATRAGTGGSYQQRAFFFVDGRYIGTDSSQPSGSVKVASQGETSVTLSYGMYSSGDSLCCPDSQATVVFQLNNGRLQALDPIPPAHADSGLSRL
ncbi:MAG TPA: LppP/LprE family lipoprotein [Solirubrobacteraceae bacterium]|jgi:hypothetical protein|nr:LppP/LprE family lipoprotein [Solirubrobacteraceae bacterium]